MDKPSASIPALFLRGGPLAMLEQLLAMAGSVVVILLAGAWLAEPDFGVLALMQGVLLLVNCLHTALVGEPMLVFGPGVFRRAQRSYLRLLLVVQGWGTAVLAGLFLLVGLLFLLAGDARYAKAFCGLGLCLPCVFLLRLVRRACYLLLCPGRAALGSLLHLATLVLLMLALRRADLASPLAVLVAQGASHLLAAVCLYRLLPASPDRERAGAGRVAALHAGYGAWAAVANLAWWVPAHIGFVLLAWHGELVETGALRALLALVLPAWQCNAAAGGWLLPLLSRPDARAAGAGLVRLALLGLSALMAVGGLLLWWQGSFLLHAVFDGRYDRFAALVPWVAALPLLDAVSAVLAAVLRSRRRVDLLFRANLLSAACALLGCWWGWRAGGLAGLLAGLDAAFLVSCLALGAMALAARRHDAG